jgi:hypothetical protein
VAVPTVHHTELDTRKESTFMSIRSTAEVKSDTLTGKVVDLDNRVTHIEAKLGIA